MPDAGSPAYAQLKQDPLPPYARIPFQMPLHPAIKTTILTLAALISIAAVTFIILIYHNAQNLMEAEIRSRTTLSTCNIVAQYVNEADPPRWPTSWDDLAHLAYTEVDPYWPQDRAYYEANVAIDFDTTLEHVAQLTHGTFDVIQPIGDNTGFHDYGYLTVIDAAKAAIKRTEP